MIEQQDTGRLQEILLLPKAGRTFLCGMTRSGKTTLKDQLRDNWLRHYQAGHCLIVDSKPRYRGQWNTLGMSASYLYRKWKIDQAAYVPGSIVLDLKQDLRAQMTLAFRKTNVVLLQGRRPDWHFLLEGMRIFYEHFSAKKGPRLADIDEGADFFEIDRWGGIILQALRSGGEQDFGLAIGSQRPKFLPKAVLTESDRIYLFKLKNDEDFKAIQIEGGWPKAPKEQPDLYRPPGEFWQFRYWNFLEKGYPNGGLFQLER